MKKLGFVRVGSIVNKLVLADPMANAKEIIQMIKEASDKGVVIVSTPQLALTGYTCGDLFFQEKLLKDVIKAIREELSETKIKMIVFKDSLKEIINSFENNEIVQSLYASGRFGEQEKEKIMAIQKGVEKYYAILNEADGLFPRTSKFLEEQRYLNEKGVN